MSQSGDGAHGAARQTALGCPSIAWTVMIGFGAFLALGFIASFGEDPSETPEAPDGLAAASAEVVLDSTETTVAETTTTTAAPTDRELITEALSASVEVREIDVTDGEVSATLYDGMWNDDIENIEYQFVTVFMAIAESGADYSGGVRAVWFTDGRDAYGNDKEVLIADVSIDADTASKINWEAGSTRLWDVLANLWQVQRAHPNIQWRN